MTTPARLVYQNNWRKAKRKGPRGGELRDDNRKARAKAEGAEIGEIPRNWEACRLVLQEWMCWWCEADIGWPGNYQADHIKPLVEGGAHTVENLVLACVACNARRGGMV